MTNSFGKIFIVATPIGNLEDVTLRALKVLNEVDFILAEDTRVSRKLLQKYKIKKNIITYQKFNEKKQTKKIITELKKGKKIAIVSDAGTPLISDPGKILISECIKESISVIPIPGPSSLTALLSVCPFDTTNFIFLGFLEKNKIKRKKQLEKIINYSIPFFFFESPYRLLTTLKIIQGLNSNMQLIIGRELTKKFEEIIYNSVSYIYDYFSNKSQIKGEFIIGCENLSSEKEIKIFEKVKEDIIIMEKLKFSSKDIANFLSEKYKIKKKQIYSFLIDKKENKGKV